MATGGFQKNFCDTLSRKKCLVMENQADFVCTADFTNITLHCQNFADVYTDIKFIEEKY